MRVNKGMKRMNLVDLCLLLSSLRRLQRENSYFYFLQNTIVLNSYLGLIVEKLFLALIKNLTREATLCTIILKWSPKFAQISKSKVFLQLGQIFFEYFLLHDSTITHATSSTGSPCLVKRPSRAQPWW